MGCGNSVPIAVVPHQRLLAEEEEEEETEGQQNNDVFVCTTVESVLNAEDSNTTVADTQGCNEDKTDLLYSDLVAGFERSTLKGETRLTVQDYRGNSVSVLEGTPKNETNKVAKWADDFLRAHEANGGIFFNPERPAVWPDSIIRTDAVKACAKKYHLQKCAQEDEIDFAITVAM